MKQKADHHLEFLADRNDRSSVQPLLFPPIDGPSTSSRGLTASSSLNNLPLQPSPLREGSQLPVVGDEDAAGESDDAVGEESFRYEATAGPQNKVVGNNEDGPSGSSASQGASTPIRSQSTERLTVWFSGAGPERECQ